MNKILIERVKGIIANELRIKEVIIKMDSKFKEDLGADETQIMYLIMGVQEEFCITIPDEDIDNIDTLEILIKYIEALSE